MSETDGMDALHRVQNYIEAAKSRPSLMQPRNGAIDNASGRVLNFEDVEALAEYAAATIDGFTAASVAEERKRAATEIEQLKTQLALRDRQVSHLRGRMAAFGASVTAVGEAIERTATDGQR